VSQLQKEFHLIKKNLFLQNLYINKYLQNFILSTFVQLWIQIFWDAHAFLVQDTGSQ